MGRSPTHLTTTFLPLLFLSLLFRLARISSAIPATPRLLRPPHAQARTAFLLPLHHHSSSDSSQKSPSSSSSLPSSSSPSSYPHRHLQRSGPNNRSNARMSLHDDLLLNGYYTTRLWIGTPPQKFALIVDTGSSVTYVPCSTCDQCGKHQDPRFDPELSSTYQAVKCNIDCNCDNDQTQCIYERQYAEMSTSSGVLGEDILSFGNLSALTPQRAVFGCENLETGDLYSQHADGIMGLGRGDLSVVDQLVDRGVISDSFSLCYGGMDIGGGSMVLGGITPPPDMVFADSDAARSPYYNIDLKEIHVGGKQLPINPGVFDGKHGTILDSGTTYAYLPDAAFIPFKDAVIKELQSLKQIHGPDPNYNDICFSGAGSDISQLTKKFPAVGMVFSNGQKLSLSPENYLFQHSKVRGAYCLGVFPNGRDPTTLIGGIIVRNTLVMYDREHSKIGFWKTNCSELWERLHITGSPPTMAPAPVEKNSSSEVPPTLAPNESPDYVLPEDHQIGKITFEVSFNISYSDLKPHMTELVEYIAPELDVNISQVQVLNFTSNTNYTVIRLAILPAGSADFISNTTAVSVIAHLAEHGIQLPATFSGYKLVGWNIVPKVKRKWWHQEYLVVILAILVTLFIGLSAFGMWFIWRRRQQALISYKPVNSAVIEQELQLQPL
ncbi:aspartic proteinase CDR1 isoform X1 [Cannabis sativa]|uniref:aspartic proteinase CDR1 isoform X1 n=1 Tax=Cannabis sativa TaxID=3483 RepID=UPI0029CA6DA2|nr:aspartic proteinase CDR1 isoform X1 [Cannabis sativa]